MKLNTVATLLANPRLLIEPLGIETTVVVKHCVISFLLIEPLGIETMSDTSFKASAVLLIEPLGIETKAE